MTNCLGENTVIDLVDAMLAPARRSAVEAHTAGCDACRRLISELVRRSSIRGDDAPAPSAPLQPGTRVGRYVVRGQIGRGAMGAVYAAHDPELDRAIALKVLHPQAAHRDRIRHEARALARLSHPNVVTAFDLGELAGDLVLAMELVDGTSLRAWMAPATPRSVDELLDAFRQAGRGLAAAHDAGLVHRDFKPDNVVVGGDGRVRVLDFGLAAGRDGGTELVGTPAYMAPEQFDDDGAATARSDQFAFCVALYEALHGVRPFALNLAGDIARGPAPGPFARRVPAHVAVALARGLRTDPAMRFPSMAALVSALAPPRMRVPTRVAIGGAAALAVAGAAVVVTLHASATPARASAPATCDAGATFAATWNAGRAQALHARFTATAAPFAESTWRVFDAGLDSFGTRWTAAQTEACRAHATGAQSDRTFALRSACLASALGEADALATTYATIDRAGIDHASAAVGELPALAACANVAALAAPTPPRDAGAAAAIAAQIATARALRDAADWPAARAAAAKAVEAARAIDHAPTRAAALFVRGEAELGAGDAKAAEATLRDAFATAEIGHDDLLAARAATEMIFVLGQEQDRYAEGDEWAFHAETALQRAGGDAETAARIATDRANILYNQNKPAEARDAYQRALDLRTQAGMTGRSVAEMRLNIARAEMAAGDNPKALELATRGLAELEPELGAGHPDLAMALGVIAMIQNNQGKFADSIATWDRALAIAEPALGPTHVEVGRMLAGRGIALSAAGRDAEALATTERAVAVFDRPGGNRRMLAEALSGLGDAQKALKQTDAAFASYRRMLAIEAETVGRESEDVARAHELLGDLDASIERYEAALAEYRLASAIRDKVDPPDYVEKSTPLGGIGVALWHLGRAGEAVAPLRRAVTLLAGYDGDPVALALLRFALARAIWDAHGDRAEARAVIDTAETALAAAGAPAATDLGELRAWRTAHR